ncbi:MAG TPA: hypothetical protein DCR97_01685 [Deltaproteobacteria bacterium]|nr:hypothetical protein [Deltaproteobacteria bacterium]
MKTSFDKGKNGKRKPFIVAGFCILLIASILPLCQMVFRPFPDLRSEENRVLATKPVFSRTAGTHEFIRGFEAYFDDNFGFRNLLIRINTLIHLKIFHISPMPLNEVVVGKSGWLFYNVKSDGSSFDDYYGLDALDSRQLRVIKQNMETMKGRLADLNIALVFVITPTKHSIYEEYLPSGVALMKGNPHRADQVVGVWDTDDTRASLIDLRAILREKKKEWPYPLYLKTDTHWNNLGSFIAYEEIIRRARRYNPHVRVVSARDFRIFEKPLSSSGDLCRMINLDRLIDESDVVFEPLVASRVTVSEIRTAYYRYGWSSTAKRVRPVKVLLFGDSFSERLIPFLAESFSEGLYFTSPLTVDFAIIEKERPDVLVIEMNERYVGSLKVRWSSKQTRPERWVFPAPVL